MFNEIALLVSSWLTSCQPRKRTQALSVHSIISLHVLLCGRSLYTHMTVIFDGAGEVVDGALNVENAYVECLV